MFAQIDYRWSMKWPTWPLFFKTNWTTCWVYICQVYVRNLWFTHRRRRDV